MSPPLDLDDEFAPLPGPAPVGPPPAGTPTCPAVPAAAPATVPAAGRRRDYGPSHLQDWTPTGTVAVDVEIARTVEEVGGWEHTGSFGVACAVVYDYGRRRYQVYDAGEVDALRACLDRADVIVSHNGWTFDLPVIYGTDRDVWVASGHARRPGGSHGRPLVERSLDMLRLLYQYQGLDPIPTGSPGPAYQGCTLGELASATLGLGKAGAGADAPGLFKDGQWGKLITYCMHDVWLTWQLETHLRLYGYLINGCGKVIRKPVGAGHE